MYSCWQATVIPKMPSKVQVFETKSHIFQRVFYFFYEPNKFAKFTAKYRLNTKTLLDFK
jgi:hypothetical protein